MTLGKLLPYLSGARCVEGAGRKISGFSTDSRAVRKGGVFIALDGKRTRGVDHIAEVVQRKAAAVVADRKYAGLLANWKGRIAVITVPDSRIALAGCCRYRRSVFEGSVIGITGSNGKTTTRNLIAGLLGKRFAVHQSEKNFNNEIGVPLTVFGLKPRHDVLVAECGISRPGEMARLAEMLQPEIAVLTNVAPAHLAGLGSERRVMEEKSLLLLASRRLVVAGSANPRLGYLKRRLRRGVRLVTVHPTDTAADLRFDTIEDCGLDGWIVRWKGVRMRTPLYGFRALENLVIALAVAGEMGVPAREAAMILPRIRSVEGRSDVLRRGRITLLDESYNANPASVTGSLDILDSVKTGEERIAVIGAMAELGPGSGAFHRALGRRLAASSAASVYLCGEDALPAFIVLSRLRPDRDVRFFEEQSRLKEAFVKKLRSGKGCLALVKGSRSCGLDRIVSYAKEKLSLR